MHIFTCFTDGLFAKSEDEADFLEKLKATGATRVSRTDGCTEDKRTMVITVFEAPLRWDDQFPETGVHSVLGRIAHSAHELLGEKINKLTVVDASGHHPRYQIRIGDAATHDA